jgi:molybdenum cofactor cytidylyltransferase
MEGNKVALLLMAGGRSERFGASDKLMADLGGRPLGVHSAKRLSDMGWAQKLAVAHDPIASPLSDIGFQILPPHSGPAGLGDNIALGANALTGVDAVLILLADMPFITAPHVNTLLSLGGTATTIVASENQGVFSPPILFPALYFDALRRLSNDEGARTLLKANWQNVVLAPAHEDILLDCDTPEAFEKAKTIFASGISL